MAKKNTKPAQQTLSPSAYIRQKGRTLEIHECFIPGDEFSSGEGVVIVSRKHTGGNLTFGCFLLDTYCTGVKDCFVAFRKSEEEFNDYVDRIAKSQGMLKVDYEVAHNWIFGAIEWAEEAGLQPSKEFALAKYLLADDEDESIPIIEYKFGDKGKHHLISDNMAELKKLEPILHENLGEGNYDITLVTDSDPEDSEDE